MNVSIKYGHSFCKVLDRIPKGVNDVIWGECSYQELDAEYLPYGHGWHRLYHRSLRTFPTGLLPRVRRILELQGCKVQILEADVRREVERIVYPQIPARYTERPYQESTLQEMLKHGRCMIRVATGGGKTIIAGYYMKKIGSTFAFFVHTKDLLYQAKAVFSDMFNEEHVGQVGDGVIDLKPLTIVTLQSAARCLDAKYVRYKYDEGEVWDDEETALDAVDRWDVAQWLRAVGGVIMDECHRVAAPTAISVISACKSAQHQIGLSASPWRDDGADMELEGVFGHVAVEINATELQQLGFLVPAYIRFVDVPARRFPKQDTYSAVYSKYIAGNEDRNGIVVRRTIDLIERGKQTLVLVRLISHGKLLQEMLAEQGVTLPFLSGRDSSAVRNRVLFEMRSQALPGMIATTIADEGLDIKPLAGLVLAGGGKSSTRALQRVGRVLRPFPNKAHAEVVDFEDNARWLSNHSSKRHEIYRTEDGWTIMDI